MNLEKIPEIEIWYITLLRNNKAPGPDGILAEMLNEGRDHILKTLQRLFNVYLHKAEIPNDNSKLFFCTRRKMNELKNYGPTSPLSQLYKLFLKTIKNR